MSLFQTVEIACPECGEKTEFGVNYSINADRRPDFREAILKGTFQRKACGKCSHSFRMEPQLTYLDTRRGQLILVMPNGEVGDWDALEEAATAIHTEMFGPNSADQAQAIGKKLKIRVCFGWAALREKLLCRENGIDDADLELAKLAILATAGDSPLSDRSELRLGAVEAGELVLGWISTSNEMVLETIRVPKQLLADIAADPAAWKAPREQLTAGPYVDYQRLLVPAAG